MDERIQCRSVKYLLFYPDYNPIAQRAVNGVDRAEAFFNFCFGSTPLFFAKLMFDKYNVLNGVTSNFEGGMGSTDSSNASVEAVQTNRKR